jgi:multicomponent Na+:H+ antiporter subunit D
MLSAFAGWWIVCATDPGLGRSLIEDAALDQPGWHWVPAAMAAISALAAGALLRAGLRVFAGIGEPRRATAASQATTRTAGTRRPRPPPPAPACSPGRWCSRRWRSGCSPDVHGPGLTAYLSACTSLAGALAVAAVALTGQTLPGPAMRAVNALRSLRSGHPGDYAAWTAAGAAALAGVLVLATG